MPQLPFPPLFRGVCSHSAAPLSAFLALVAADANSDANSAKSVTLTSAEEELVAIEGEHARELERLRADLAASKADTARSVARAEASDALVRKARREGETTRSENEHLYRVIDRSNSTLGPKGTSIVLRALKALDAIEARAVATYRVATRAMDVARRASALTAKWKAIASAGTARIRN